MDTFARLIFPDIREMIRSNNVAELKAALEHLHPADIAELIAQISDQEAKALFKNLPTKERVDVFEHLEEAEQIRLLELEGYRSMIGVLDEMSPDDRADLMKALPENTVDVLLPLMARIERNDVKRLVAHPEGTAGALMTTDFASISKSRTASGALADLRVAAGKKETIYYIYVTDPNGRLLGVLSLHDLIFARPDTQIEEIMNRDPIAVAANADDEAVAQTMEHYDFLAIPVVDGSNRLLGIVTHDDVLDVVQEEATEDAHRMGAIEPLELPYLRESIITMMGKRGGWLLLFFFAQIFTIWALDSYQDSLTKVIALVTFIPLIISSGGNTGAQSATLICRALAVGDVELAAWRRIVARELVTGLSLGIALGTCGFCLAYTVGQIFGTPSEILVDLSATVALTILGVVTFGAVVGATLPLMFKRIGLDPAMSSSPFVASLVDVVGILIYANIGRIILEI